MRRTFVFAAVMTLAMALAPVAHAGQPAVSITGGGTSDNILGLGGERTAGFNAHLEADGTARGQVQMKTVLESGLLMQQIHGSVTCIAATSGATGGDGWEIRFEITKSKGLLAFLFPVGKHMSLFVRDEPAGDQIDDFFAGGAFGDLTTCGHFDSEIKWESVNHGDVKVRS